MKINTKINEKTGRAVVQHNCKHLGYHTLDSVIWHRRVAEVEALEKQWCHECSQKWLRQR